MRQAGVLPAERIIVIRSIHTSQPVLSRETSGSIGMNGKGNAETKHMTVKVRRQCSLL